VDKTLVQVAVFLAASAIAAPLGRFLKLGAVIGYLAAGVLIGPFGLGFVYEVYQVGSILHIAELGVILLLFLIGLELRPQRLWAMRRVIVEAGGWQVAASALLIAAAAFLAGLATIAAVVIGLTLAMSSTAFALQVLEEKGELQLRHGRVAFSILLLQDLVAIPLLAVVPLLALQGGGDQAAMLLAVAKAVAVIAAVVVLGRYVLGVVYRLVARSGVREAMTASALLTVVGVSLLMQSAGLSAALGAFIAGALLADSEYRHQIEADIQPFEGLLLGLFFTAIGMSLNLRLVASEPALIALLVTGLVAVKAVVLFVVGRMQGLETRAARRLALFLSQGGEFAFVLLTLSVGARVIDPAMAERLAVVVTLSMIATPLLLIADEVLFPRRVEVLPAFDAMPEGEGHVVIAGFGRVGQIVARVLRAKRIPFTALDISPDQVQLVRRFGSEAYFGDAARLDILEAARTAKARAFVLAIDDVEASIAVAVLVRQHFPDVPIYARARNRQHVHRLMDLGVRHMRRETFLSSIELTRDVLRGLGLKEAEVQRITQTFIVHDRKRLYDDYQHASEPEKLVAMARDSARELEALLAADEAAPAVTMAAPSRPARSSASGD